VSRERHATDIGRQRTADDREPAARARDAQAAERDERSRGRDKRARLLEQAIAKLDPAVASELLALREQAAADRAAAARDRARAAADREKARRERLHVEEKLRTAHLDDLTGAYRRDMGRLALEHEIERARRANGRFVVAFIDVDDLKGINDRDGHRAGDEALRAVVDAVRSKVRSFDPVLRYGGDEFVAGLSGVDVAEARRRFEFVRRSLAEEAGVTISVGFAELDADATAEALMDRADLELAASRRNGRRRVPESSASS
jgi:diguanylate cyclase (GGDEF)-like protein